MSVVSVEAGDGSRVDCDVWVACRNMIVKNCRDCCLIGSLVGALVGLVDSLDPTLTSFGDVELVVCIACILEPCLEGALVQVNDSCRALSIYKSSSSWAVCNRTNILVECVVDSNCRVEVSDIRGGISALFGGVILGFLGDAPVVGLELDRRLLTGFNSTVRTVELITFSNVLRSANAAVKSLSSPLCIATIADCTTSRIVLTRSASFLVPPSVAVPFGVASSRIMTCLSCLIAVVCPLV